MPYKDLVQRMESKPHGTRGKYVAGCRCDECKTANRNYARKRAAAIVRGNTNELVDAKPTRLHLKQLRRDGIGLRTVAEYSHIGRSALQQIRDGTKLQIRRQTAERILAVNKRCIQGSTLVSARMTMQQIEWLLNEGFTKRALAQRLGYSKALQIRPGPITGKILASTARKVERLYTQLRLGE